MSSSVTPEAPTGADLHAAGDDAAPPLDQIRGLVTERARYEGWLEALDARQGATPAHVLDRVRQDYVGRLARVFDQLAAFVEPLRRRQDGLARRHAQVEQSLVEQRDALAETELRTLVGEYAPDEGEQRRQQADQAIGTLERELSGTATELADLRALAGRVTPPGATNAAPAATSAQPVVAEGAGHTIEGGTPSQGSATAQAPAPVPNGGPTEAPNGAPSAVAVADRWSNWGQPASPTTSPTAPSAAGDVTAVGRGDAGAVGFRPGDQVAVGQEKTLRCHDCGALNYPTEWYCEKCGGELAAM